MATLEEAQKLIENTFQEGLAAVHVQRAISPPEPLDHLPIKHICNNRGWVREVWEIGSLFVYGAGEYPRGRELLAAETPIVWCRFLKPGSAFHDPLSVTLRYEVGTDRWECHEVNLDSLDSTLRAHLPNRIDTEGARRIIRYLVALFFSANALPSRDWSMTPGLPRPPT